MDKNPGFKPGKIILICKPFRSYDGYLLIERFMCVLKIKEDNILLLPMSTFHSEVIKNEKLSYKDVFEYSEIHGNTRDGYIKCNQIYILSKDDFSTKKVKLKHQMSKEYFRKLKDQVESLQRDNKTNFFF